MKELIFHIGVHKTGSSSIQHFLYDNREILLKNYGLNYPEMKGDTHYFQHNSLTSLLKKGKTNDFSEIVKRNSTSGNRLLLSSESFAGIHEISRGIISVQHLFDRVRVIAYVRRQDLWLESIYRQLIKTDGVLVRDKFDVWLKKFFRRQRGIYMCDWMEILNPWIDLIGVENIIVRPYEKSQFFKGNIIEDFLNIIDIPFNRNEFSDNLRMNNKSYNLEASEFLRLMNHTKEIDKWRMFLNVIFDNPFHDTGEVYLSYAKRQEVMGRFHSSNRKVADLFLQNNSSELFVEPLPEEDNYPPVFQGLNHKDFTKKSVSIINNLQKAIILSEKDNKSTTTPNFLEVVKSLIRKK